MKQVLNSERPKEKAKALLREEEERVVVCSFT